MSVTADTIDATDEELADLLEMMRMILRDKGANNILLNDIQFEEKEIKRAIKLAVSGFNSMPPRTTLGWRHLPEDLLFLGTASWLMLSESFLQLRNQVSVPTDGLGVVGIDDKSQFYQQLRERLSAEFKQTCRQIKNEMNIAAGFGSMHSGYAGVSRFTNR